jgi:hypothetical protein
LDVQRIGWFAIFTLVCFDVYVQADVIADLIVGIRCIIIHVELTVLVTLDQVSDDLGGRVVFRDMAPGTVNDPAEQVKPGIAVTVVLFALG